MNCDIYLSVDNVDRLDKDCVFSWMSLRPCVDYKHSVVFCARNDGTIDKLTRNQHTQFKVNTTHLHVVLLNCLRLTRSEG